MCSEKQGSSVPTTPSSPAVSASPAPPNAFDGAFQGYAVQSRAAWGEAVGWLEVFDEDLIARVSWAEALMRSPEALAYFLEACGKLVLEHAGAILQERVVSAAR